MKYCLTYMWNLINKWTDTTKHKKIHRYRGQISGCQWENGQNRWKELKDIHFSSVQSLSHVRLFATPWILARQTSLFITNSWSLSSRTQTHAHWVGDAIQPSHPLSSSSPPVPSPSQHQGLFQWVNSLHEVAKELEFQLQNQSFQWTPRTDLL